MTKSAAPQWDETILPFQLDHADIRGRVVRLDGVLRKILGQHAYPPLVEALIAEMALLTALIGSSVKLRGKLSLQVQTNGPVRMIATDFFPADVDAGTPAQMRAYAGFDADRLSGARPFDQLGEGYFAIMMDQGKDMRPYQGISPIAGGSLCASAEAYFAQSEQLPTRFALSFGQSQTPGGAADWRAGGVMLQHMPKASLQASGEAGEDGLPRAEDLLQGDDQENWNRANLLLDTVEEIELIGPTVTPEQLLIRLFHEESPRVFDHQPIQFGCTCGEDRVRQSLSIYSAKDIQKMTTEDGRVTADCQFCGAHYDLDPLTVGFDAVKAP